MSACVHVFIFIDFPPPRNFSFFILYCGWFSGRGRSRARPPRILKFWRFFQLICGARFSTGQREQKKYRRGGGGEWFTFFYVARKTIVLLVGNVFFFFCWIFFSAFDKYVLYLSAGLCSDPEMRAGKGGEKEGERRKKIHIKAMINAFKWLGLAGGQSWKQQLKCDFRAH